MIDRATEQEAEKLKYATIQLRHTDINKLKSNTHHPSKTNDPALLSAGNMVQSMSNVSQAFNQTTGCALSKDIRQATSADQSMGGALSEEN